MQCTEKRSIYQLGDKYFLINYEQNGGPAILKSVNTYTPPLKNPPAILEAEKNPLQVSMCCYEKGEEIYCRTGSMYFVLNKEGIVIDRIGKKEYECFVKKIKISEIPIKDLLKIFSTVKRRSAFLY